MINLEMGEKSKVISLHNRRMRKKYIRIFNFLNKISRFFHINAKTHKENRDSYKKSVNH
jgi:hypothetical protein